MGDELSSTAPKSEDVLYSTCNFASIGRPVNAPLQTASEIARQIDQAMSFNAEKLISQPHTFRISTGHLFGSQ